MGRGNTPPGTAAARPVGILGGMGPAAAIDLAAHFLAACAVHIERQGGVVCDQAFPEHWIAQVPAPDRSQALASGGDDRPYDCMARALHRFADMRACAVAIACNTAHAWHARLQVAQPTVELLHVADEVARHARARGIDRVGLLATTGTYQSGLYQAALHARQVRCDSPPKNVRALVMRGIYDGVKANDLALAQRCFAEAVQQARAHFGDVPLVLGCTEIPLALRAADAASPSSQGLHINPNLVLAQALADRAFAAADRPTLSRSRSRSLPPLQEVFP